jgi:hypothetical protein
LSDQSLTRIDWAVATFAMVAIAVHDAAHVAAGRYWDAFWICNVAALFVGPAILLRSPAMAAVALTWLVPGTVVWLLDVALAGSNILPTSYAVHLGGTAAALYATRTVGFCEIGWVWSLLVLAASTLASRLFLPKAANVNAAHAIPHGWTVLGSTRVAFVATAIAIVLATCLLGRILGRAIARPRV